MHPKLKTISRVLWPLAALALLGAAGLGLLFGDGCGPVERGLRAVLGTWDMWQSPAVMPHEKPLLEVPAPSGTAEGHVSELPKMMPEYYAARGWRDGVVPDEKLRELGIL